jgi:putative oxidoreductase
VSRFWELLARLILGGVFLYAGTVKIIDPGAFAGDIANYRLLPHELINLLAITLPWIEVVAGALLVFGRWPKASALILTLLMVVFLIAIAQALARGLDIRCGCFGTVEGGHVGAMALLRDGVFLALGVWLTWRLSDGGRKS